MLSRLILVVALIYLHLKESEAATDCNKRYFQYESFVCVCDANYCDFMDDLGPVPQGTFQRIISSQEEFRMTPFNGTLTSEQSGDNILYIARSYEYQTMLGFGGAFTDSTGLNILTLSEAAQDVLLRSYFAPEGLQYNLGRIPIAGSDFSTRPYSYDDVPGDVELDNWALTDEDFNYKIPFIQKAIDLADREILLFGSPWAPPAWMKSNGMFNGTGILLKEFWDPYSNYLVKFVQAYENDYNLTIWGFTPQNEPGSGFDDWPWNTCGWTAEDMRDWIKQSMGPIFTNAGYRRLKFMVLDFNRDYLPAFPRTILEDADANQYVDGVAVHWYSDNGVGPEVLTETQAEFPDKFMLYTEGCEGYYGDMETRVQLGSWQRAENYMFDILENVNHFSTGWVDWNMALDVQGGPNWANNFVDAPIIINATADEFLKQPTFYAMGHFSKFVVPGARRLFTSLEGSSTLGVEAAAFHNPDDSETIVILNTNDFEVTLNVKANDGSNAVITLNPNSFETLIMNF